MMHTTMARTTARGAFLLNRVIRVVPLYWLITLVVFAAAAAVPGAMGATRADVSDLLRSLAFVPFRKANGLIHPMLFVGWTLNYEMMFYLLFALALPAGTPRRRLAWVAGVLTALIVLAAAIPARLPLAVVFWGNPIVLEFAAGMAVALLAGKVGAVPPRVAAVGVAAGLAVLIGAGFSSGVTRTALAGGAGVVILIGALALERHRVVLSQRGVQLLGAASYALYLTHPFATQAAIKLAARAGIADWRALLAALIGALALAVLTAIALHLLIERPLGRALRAAAGHRAGAVERSAPRIA